MLARYLPEKTYENHIPTKSHQNATLASLSTNGADSTSIEYHNCLTPKKVSLENGWVERCGDAPAESHRPTSYGSSAFCRN
jgi:hypothetical protein